MFGWTMDPESPNFEVKVIEKCSETELKVVEPRLVSELSADRPLHQLETWKLFGTLIRVPVATQKDCIPSINKHDS